MQSENMWFAYTVSSSSLIRTTPDAEKPIDVFTAPCLSPPPSFKIKERKWDGESTVRPTYNWSFRIGCGSTKQAAAYRVCKPYVVMDSFLCIFTEHHCNF